MLPWPWITILRCAEWKQKHPSIPHLLHKDVKDMNKGKDIQRLLLKLLPWESDMRELAMYNRWWRPLPGPRAESLGVESMVVQTRGSVGGPRCTERMDSYRMSWLNVKDPLVDILWRYCNLQSIYIYARPPPKIYLFDVWREFIYEINPLLSYLKWIHTWTPIQMAHTNNAHKQHTISYPNQTFCPICITLPLTDMAIRFMFFHDSLWTGIVDKLINNTI